MHKEVVIHTHYNTPNEVTGISQDAMNLLFERGITVRNQAVFQRGVNDNAKLMTGLGSPFGVILTCILITFMFMIWSKGPKIFVLWWPRPFGLKKRLRGAAAGFNTPLFVVDAPGGGGKRDAHSYEHYDRETGISVYTAPAVKKGEFFTYFDPLRSLDPEIQKFWHDPNKREQMLNDVVQTAKARYI